jgi:hypothetical protein
MVLSCNDDLPDYIEYARHAVKVIDVDIRELLKDSPPAHFPQKQLDEARRLLGQARSHYAMDARTAERERKHSEGASE